MHSYTYHKNLAIIPGLMHEGCAGEGRSTALNSSIVSLVKYGLIDGYSRHGMAFVPTEYVILNLMHIMWLLGTLVEVLMPPD